IEEGTLELLLQSTLHAQQDAVLVVDSSTEKAAFHIEGGRVHSIHHQHARVESTLQSLKDWKEGRYLLCRAYTPEAHAGSSNYGTNLWLVDQDTKRRKELHETLESKGFTVCVVLDPSEIPDLLNQKPPTVVLLGAEGFKQNPRTFEYLQIFAQHEVARVFLGKEEQPPNTFADKIEFWFQVPEEMEELIAYLHKKVPPFLGNKIQTLDPAWVQVLCDLTPPLSPNMKLQINPARWQALQEKELPPVWKEWLLSFDSRQPLARWLKNYPGDPRHARLSMQLLIRLGALEELTKNNITIAKGSKDEPSLSQAVSEHHSNFSWLKVLALGLEKQRLDDFVQALRDISRSQSARIPRDHRVQIPYLSHVEYARIPLRKDALLVVYGLSHEHQVDQLFDLIGLELASFLFFVDPENAKSTRAIKPLRESLLARYPGPELLVLPNHNTTEEQLQQVLQLSPQTPIEYAEDLNLKSTYKLLRQLLVNSPMVV
ncbi:MAG: hypothetical protein AAGJ35_01465, partial [Myxococcota bacterium]